MSIPCVSTFNIPAIYNNDLCMLSNDQLDKLKISISKFANCYITEHKLSLSTKNTIELDKFLDIRFNILNNEKRKEKST